MKKTAKKKYAVTAVRTYYSVVEFEVEAESEEQAYQIADQMIADCEVEFDGIDCGEDKDDIEVTEVE